MRRLRRLAPLAVVVAVLAAGCGGGDDSNSGDGGDTGLANPASVFCEEQGGSVEITTADDGSQSGTCVLADGTRMDEWEYYRQYHSESPTG